MSKYHLLIVLVLALVNISAFAQTGAGQQGQTAAPAVSADYKLGPGDEIRVIVQNHENLSGDYLVPEGGMVVFPEIGSTQVQGLSIIELTGSLTKKLNEILIDPNVTVVLKTLRPRYVTVTGDVQHPMPVIFVPTMRLVDAVTAAGGLNPEIKPAECQVTLTHAGQTKTIAFPELLSDPSKNFPVQAGDTVDVDSGSFTVYVVGQVKLPGLQRLKRGSGLVQAVASAGGPTEDGAIDRLHVTSLDGTQRDVDITPAFVHGETEELPALHPGDLIDVPVTKRKFYVLGYVGLPGLYVIPAGQNLSLADVLTMAKGQDQEHRGRLGRVIITRSEEGKPKTYAYDFGKFLHDGDPKCNPTIMAGDMVYVPETNKVNPLTAASIAQALATLAVFLKL